MLPAATSHPLVELPGGISHPPVAFPPSNSHPAVELPPTAVPYYLPHTMELPQAAYRPSGTTK